MPLDISDALSDGLDRTFQRNGLLLVVAFVVFGLADAVAGQTLAAATARFAEQAIEQLPQDASTPQTVTGLPSAEATPLSLPLPLPAALGLVAVLAFVAEAVRIVAVRTLVSDETETVRDEFVSRNLLSATLNGFVGGVVVLILVAVGLVFLVVPGVYLAIAFFFVRQEIAVEDRNFVEALSASWERTSGHRLRLFGLALVVFLVGVVVTAVGGVVGFVGVPLLTTLVTVLLGAVTVVFGVAVTCRAYVQLSDADDADRDVDVDTDEESEWKYNP
ncbi:hypothetical protein [Salinigranum sp.]|uniref:hypothetical protein n=1 Tax=Salinigranum sp. TaxID=1966351 RepID=UPI00356B5EA4